MEFRKSDFLLDSTGPAGSASWSFLTRCSCFPVPFNCPGAAVWSKASDVDVEAYPLHDQCHLFRAEISYIRPRKVWGVCMMAKTFS